MDQIEPDIQVLGRLSVQKARWDMLTPCAVSTHMRYLSQKGEVEGERPLGHGLTWRGNSKGTRAWSESGGQRRDVAGAPQVLCVW
jgi:hypothetical protein